MRVLVAPDKFKGTFTATEVAAAMAAGVEAAGVEAVQLPAADGGDDTAAALLAAKGGRWVQVAIEDALGRPKRTEFVLLDDGTAVVEAAAAVGMADLPAGNLPGIEASSRGFGLLIKSALEMNPRRLIVAPGGSATSDGGAGMLSVLEGVEAETEIVVACDVQTPFEEAVAVFGPQKGVAPEQIAPQTKRLLDLAGSWSRDPVGRPMTGCGGGISGALWSCLGAGLVAGADLVLDEIGFDRQLADADLTLTGEGRIDAQTALGKTVSAVAGRSRKAGVPCIAIVGSRDLDEAGMESLGLDSIVVAPTLAEIRQAARALIT